MKMYVCYANLGWDGLSAPMAVFDDKKAASNWCKARGKERHRFEELILNEPLGWRDRLVESKPNIKLQRHNQLLENYNVSGF